MDCLTLAQFKSVLVGVLARGGGLRLLQKRSRRGCALLQKLVRQLQTVKEFFKKCSLKMYICERERECISHPNLFYHSFEFENNFHL